MSARRGLLLAGLLAGGLVVAQATQPEAPAVQRSDGAASSSRLEPIVGSLAVCPELIKRGSDVKTRLTLGTPSPGEIVVRAAPLVAGGGQGLGILDKGGVVSNFGVPQGTNLAVAATAVGPASGELEAEQLSRGADGPQRGLANVRCESVSQDTWFVGGSTRIGADSQLVLVNPYDESALVDLDLYGRTGVVDNPDGEGIVIGPRRRAVVALANLAPDEPALAVRVVVREGRVAPSLRDERALARVPLGVDWVPRAGMPSGRVDLAGIPEGNGPRLVYVAVPGDDDATVSISVTLADGTFPAEGLQDLVLPAGRLSVVDVTKVLGGRSASLRLEADNATFVAGAYVENRSEVTPIHEFAYVGAAHPLTGPALVTDNQIAAGVNTLLIFSAPDGAARVEVRLVAVRGRPEGPGATRTYAIPQGRLVAVPLSRAFPPSALRPLVVTPLPGSAPVFATRAILERGPRGPLFTVLTLVTQPAAGVPVPEVLADLTVSLPDPRRRT